ncbi:TPA: hypothetical protein ACSE38_002974 [Acinetobacter baumannii]|uniref:Uncharacterized protein n=7 Tax=Acinetobacter calcoaceticus/baumannii complex TaxID=909768 RepID=A0A242TSB2_ACIBA|nr:MULTISPECIES: hypothetical protein [Gammaproteobacteria]AHX28413.1 hypothetical protein A478_07450 [Acinetobacter baumannii AC12]AHX66038.1 hypothetical protein B856_12300 [Acinetobacter baumannii AC30]AEP05374.1 hypothetical protein ABZJ_00914 [Acinetobacter baumannii MDR-ZJ06]AFU37209.1 hypothetical protein M3Q_1117 [Acinetobacter baumannii TYTH-1]ARG14562.1 hypothetical protein B7L36_17690 [Acinetobacter baumannii]
MMRNIPDSMSFPFTVWMCENGYYPSHKNGFIILKRGKEVAKISMNETKDGYPMNDICQKKFASFCRAWMNRDKHFIEQLRLRGLARLNQKSYQMVA